MGTYTSSILNLLQDGSAGRSLNPLKTEFPDNVRDIAKDVIFGANLEVIDPKYRDVFAAGFCFNFMNDEIGLESVPSWQLALAGRLRNNASFINQIYLTMDKQIFSNYSTRKLDTKGFEERAETVAEKILREEAENTASEVLETGTGSVGDDGNTTVLTEDTSDSTIKNTSTNSGVDKLDKSGTDKVAHNTEDSTTFGKKTQRGGDLTDNYLNLKVQNAGDVTDKGDSTLTFINRESESDGQVINKFSATPQQGLAGLMEDNYLTTAAVDGARNTTTENGSEKTDTNGKHTDASSSTTTGAISHTDDTSIEDSGTDKVKKTGDDSTTYGSSDSTTHGLKTVVEGTVGDIAGGKTNTENTNDQLTTRDFATNTDGTRDGNSKEDRDSEATGTTDRKENVIEESYTLNYEMLSLAQPLLAKVWAQFDDLFLFIL